MNDSRLEVTHATLAFERTIALPASRVFSALTDPVAKATWGAPSPSTVLIFEAVDFRPGGVERFRCGPKANPDILGTTLYHDIVQDRRVVSTETIDREGKRLCVALKSIELTQDGALTRLRATTQLASFIGDDMVRGHRAGTNAALDNLCTYLDR